MEDNTLVSSLAWVRKGFALKNPKENEFEDEDIE
jgi:hypothetical protein